MDHVNALCDGLTFISLGAAALADHIQAENLSALEQADLFEPSAFGPSWRGACGLAEGWR